MKAYKTEHCVSIYEDHYTDRWYDMGVLASTGLVVTQIWAATDNIVAGCVGDYLRWSRVSNNYKAIVTDDYKAGLV